MDCGRLASASEFNLRQVGQVGTPAVQTFWLYLSNFQKNKGGIPPLTNSHIFLLHRTVDKAPRTSPLVIEAAGQRYRQATQFLYLGGLVDASAGIMPEIQRQVRLAWACYSRFKRELYDMEAAPKVRKLKACLLYTSPSPRDLSTSRMPSSA